LRRHVYFSIRYDRWCKLCEIAERVSRGVYVAIVKFLADVGCKKGSERPGASPPLFVDSVVAAQTIPVSVSEPLADTVGPPFIPRFLLLTAEGVVAKRSFTKS
jgi:hypothetical protein